MATIDLAKFAPKSADELFEGILSEAAAAAAGDWAEMEAQVSSYLQVLARKAWSTQQDLANGDITAASADFALHTQELLLANILLEIDFLGYQLAQDVRDAVFSVITAAIKNATGVALVF